MNEQNLTPFKPGQSGNPAGKPPGIKNRATIARKVLEMKALFNDITFDKLKEQFPEISKQSTVEEIMTIIQASNAVAGCDKAYKAIMDSAYGAPKQEVDHVGNMNFNLMNIDPLSDTDAANNSTQEDSIS